MVVIDFGKILLVFGFFGTFKNYKKNDRSKARWLNLVKWLRKLKVQTTSVVRLIKMLSVSLNLVIWKKGLSIFLKKTNQCLPETRGELLLIIFESLALSYRQTIIGLEKATNESIDTIYMF